MPMHAIIQQKRRELGLTQEQVAEHLNVTAPAVSKWEKGITSPDIALLPSLARLLKTDLNTLFCFHEKLTAQEIADFCRELACTAQEDITKAFSLAEAKLREFPHSEVLHLNTAILLDSMLLRSGAGGDALADLEEKVSAWYACLTKSTDPQISSSANYMTVNRYIKQGKLDLAQATLDMIPERSELTNALPDKLSLQTAIYLKTGESCLAARELERALYLALNRVQFLLAQLANAEYDAGEVGTARSIAEDTLKLTELFGLWRYTGYTALFQVACSEKNAEKALALLDKMLDALTIPWDPGVSPFFRRVASEMKQADTRELLSILLKDLETDSGCAYLRENPGYSDLLIKYRVYNPK